MTTATDPLIHHFGLRLTVVVWGHSNAYFDVNFINCLQNVSKESTLATYVFPSSSLPRVILGVSRERVYILT